MSHLSLAHIVSTVFLLYNGICTVILAFTTAWSSSTDYLPYQSLRFPSQDVCCLSIFLWFFLVWWVARCYIYDVSRYMAKIGPFSYLNTPYNVHICFHSSQHFNIGNMTCPSNLKYTLIHPYFKASILLTVALVAFILSYCKVVQRIYNMLSFLVEVWDLGHGLKVNT